MRKVSIAWMAAAGAILLSLALGCAPAAQGPQESEGEAVAFDQLLANLDALGASPARAALAASTIPKPNGSPFTAPELQSYLSGLKVDLAGLVAAKTGGRPYLVLPVRLQAGGQSGLMWVPVSLGRRLSCPVIAFQHGTQTYWASAPSRFDLNPLSILSSFDVSGAFQNYVECTTAALMASAGYIVVMADYPGFGSSRAPHPYVNLVLGSSVQTMLLRAQAILAGPLASARPNGRLYLIGYSEGGFATLAAAKALQESGVAVTAAVPCAGSYDMSGAEIADILSGRPALEPFYAPYTLYGYASVYASLDPGVWDFAAVLQPPLAGLMPALFSGNETVAMINAQLPGDIPRSFLSPGLLAELSVPTGRVYERLRETTVFLGWAPRMLVQLIQCPEDDLVPPANTLAAKAAWAALPNVLEPIWVPPVPLPAALSGALDIHTRAFPTAMLAGFGFIAGVEARF
ncbi:MAG TPA: lipase family protein [Rectinemataceae bacterium]|nr:lipase family protein [Rectinemataceae bacterium]